MSNKKSFIDHRISIKQGINSSSLRYHDDVEKLCKDYIIFKFSEFISEKYKDDIKTEQFGNIEFFNLDLYVFTEKQIKELISESIKMFLEKDI